MCGIVRVKRHICRPDNFELILLILQLYCTTTVLRMQRKRSIFIGTHDGRRYWEHGWIIWVFLRRWPIHKIKNFHLLFVFIDPIDESSFAFESCDDLRRHGVFAEGKYKLGGKSELQYCKNWGRQTYSYIGGSVIHSLRACISFQVGCVPRGITQ